VIWPIPTLQHDAGCKHMTYSIPDLTNELRSVKERDALDCLKRSLRAAIQLEFATIPPYLMAMWSIRDSNDDVYWVINEVAVEEMLHMGLACNMLVGLGEKPQLNTAAMIPTYPSPLPGNVNPTLKVALRRLTPSQLKVFMDIEYPTERLFPELIDRSIDTIGEFYAALLKAFETVNPPLNTTYQRLEPASKLFAVEDLDDVRVAIDLIRRQGEGSKDTPEEHKGTGALAHFYQFREIYNGARYIYDSGKKSWGHNGPPVLMPPVFPVADIPPGGYQKADVPDPTAWALIEQFDRTFTTMLGQLELAWTDPAADLGAGGPNDPIFTTMSQLTSQARELMESKKRPDGRSTYGPCFRLV
jgi:hypothetical protein